MTLAFHWIWVKRSSCEKYVARLAHKWSSNLFPSAKRELEIFYVFGGKASRKAGKAEGPTYRNRKREANVFGEIRESRSSPPPASESQDGCSTCFFRGVLFRPSSKNVFFCKRLALWHSKLF